MYVCVCSPSDSWGRGRSGMLPVVINIAAPSLKCDPIVVSIESSLNNGCCSSAKPALSCVG